MHPLESRNRGGAPQLALPSLLLLLLSVFGFTAPAAASDTPAPHSVTIAGSLQSELGCPDDWQPGCATTHLTFSADDNVWQGTFNVPAGDWEYKAALNDSWDENYGLHAVSNGSNIPLHLDAAKAVKFYYDHESHWVTDNQSSVIATAPGSYQHFLGCSGDWQPDCLRAWLEDPDGDGVYTFSTHAIPAGSYEVKAAINESWDENYGAGGAPGGANIPFTVASDCATTVFSYDSHTHILTVSAGGAPPQPNSVTVAGSLQSELGCSDDWQPACATTHLTFDNTDGIWQGTFNVPAGNWEYKAPLNDSWDVNYGLHAQSNGANIPLNLAAAKAVKFYFDNGTHWITDNQNSVIATVAGSFQSELGCPGDWQPDCLRSWLQDPDGDGIYTFTAHTLPAGDYEAKVAINESWDENYGAGGAPNGANIAFTVPRSCTDMFFSYDSHSHVLTISASGAPSGNITRAQAVWVSRDTIAWKPAGSATVQPGWVFALSYDPNGGLTLQSSGVSGGTSIPLAWDPSGLTADELDKLPQLAGYATFKVPSARLAEVPAALQGQTAVSAHAGDGTLIDATALQIQGVLDDLYTYNGPLGLAFSGSAPTLRVWAPTAQSVKLHVFDTSTATTDTVVPMTADPVTGVWSAAGAASWYGKYYLYEVKVWAPSTSKVETNLVTDPYSVSLSRNSQRSQIIDLAGDATLKPAGWDTLAKPRLDAPEDIALYELHIRDFSATDPSVPDNLKGTYKAFSLADANGMKHLRSLAQAGLTHVHLLPSFDITSIDEDKSHWQQPAGNLAALPPDSDQQQAAVMAVAGQDAFNWGYDPWHYTTPEGSYSTNPDGPTRIEEFREMVKGLNGAGLRAVMDVVYNHTTAAGEDSHSVLDQVVPGYYHRLDADGKIETSSCCQNTASEFNMMEKLLIDSVLTWAEQYKVDGFRFDLMGHHMKRNIVKLRAALDALPADSGIDGKKVYLYGEGWNFGEVADNARGVNATQANMAGTGVGTFNDRTRDGARGGGPFSPLQDQGFLTGLWFDPNGTDQGTSDAQRARLLQETDWIRTGVAGGLAAYTFTDRNGNTVTSSQVDYNGQKAGYTADPQELINYIEAHDNETLFDTIQEKLPVSTSMNDRVRVQNLGMSLLAFSQGVPFYHAGVELLRSKSLDGNSYNSGDWFNKLDFTYQSNNWGVGLPPAPDNQSKWPIQKPLLANPALKPAPSDIQAALAHFEEVLAVRKSSPLFRLRTAADVEGMLRFHNTGPSQIPGLLVFSLDDAQGTVDHQHSLILVLLNSRDEELTYPFTVFPCPGLSLHPVLANSADPVVHFAAVDPATCTFHLPARTSAVFWVTRSADEQIFLLTGVVSNLATSGILNSGQAQALKASLSAADRSALRGNNTAAANQMRAFINKVQAFVTAGILPQFTGDDLIRDANAILDKLGS